MNSWRSHPDPQFVPDAQNDFACSKGLRRRVTILELMWILASGLAVAALFFALMLVGVIFGLSSWAWYLLVAGVFLVLGKALSRSRRLGKAPLRCSKCSKSMMCRYDNSRVGDQPLFYECPSCKRYVDTGVSSGG